MNGEDLAIIEKGLKFGLRVMFTANRVIISTTDGVEFEKEGRFFEQCWYAVDYIQHVLDIEKPSFN